MKLFASLLALALLVSCQSESSPSSPSGGEQTLAATTFQAGSESAIPLVGGAHEAAHLAVLPGGVKDSVDEAILNFLSTAMPSGIRYSGSVLVHQIALGTYRLDTTYYSYASKSGRMDFFRYNPGQDSCYYSSMSGNLEITTWREIVQSGHKGHLVSANLTARMGFPWKQNSRRTCPDSLDVKMSFQEAFIAEVE